MNEQIIYSTRCWLGGKLQPGSIRYESGSITEVATEFIAGAEDLSHAVIMPGIIDAHVHINEPGRTDWEGFVTATAAAAAGGICTIVDMPLNSSPVTTSLQNFDTKRGAAAGKLQVNVGFYGGLVPDNVNELPALIGAGVLGIKCFLVHSGIDEFPNVAEADLRKAMPLLAKTGLPLLVHSELQDYEVSNNSATDPNSYREYLASRPKRWENNAIAMMIRLCREFHCRVHIVHVSSDEALQLIHTAKQEGLPLTAETCPQYLLFDAESIGNGETLFKCAPPIREKANNENLKCALRDNILDFISTDHSPAPPELKQIATGNFPDAWGGISGLQFLLPASWTALKETLSLEQFIPLVTSKPAQFLKAGLSAGLKPGEPANITVWLPDEEFVVEEEAILHRHKSTPYMNMRLFGKVQRTVVNGFTVFDAAQQLPRLASGKILLHQGQL